MKFSILFLLYRSKTNTKGLCPIRCRITYNKKRKEFSTGIFINPNSWYSKKQCVKEDDEHSKIINRKLSLISQKLHQAFLFLEVNLTKFTVSDVYKKYKGETPKKEFGVVEVFDIYIKRLKLLVDKEIKLVTYKKYIESCTHLKSFIKAKFKLKDYPFKQLKNNFLVDYEYFLKTEKNLQQSTINKAIQRFRRVVKYAISEEYLNRDPFVLYKPKSVKKEVIYLTELELQKLEEEEFEIERLQKVKDMFIFCCYTGLGFKEMVSLKKKQIVKEFDDNLWLHIHRKKTNKFYKIPLLPKAEAILLKYNDSESEFVLPKMYNSHFNAYLKEIASITGVNKKLSHHIARKTFATTVLLYNDVPMEIVSKLLGHSKLQTTQDHYGEIIDKKVSEQMKRISKKLS